MADLMTRIGADDSQFHSTMNRVDSRIASFVQTTKRGFERINSIVAGFGLAAYGRSALELSRQILDIQHQQTDAFQKQMDAARERNRAHADFRASLQGEVSLTDRVRRAQIANLDAIAKMRREAVAGIEGEGVGTRSMSVLANTKTRDFLPRPGEAAFAGNPLLALAMYIDRLGSEDAGKRIFQVNKSASIDARTEAAESAKDIRAAALKEIQDDARRSAEIVKERAAALIAERQRKQDERRAIVERRRSVADRLADERVSAMQDGGRDREAALEASRLRFERMRRDMDESDVLSMEEKRAAREAIAAREREAASSIESRYTSDARLGARDGFQTVGVGGTTFAQQLSLTLKDPMQAVVQNTSSTVDKLDEIARKLDRAAFGTAYYR